MRSTHSSLFMLFTLAAAASACSGTSDAPADDSASSELRGPGSLATDDRVPELGSDLNVLRQSRISLADGIAKAERENGPVIEAKFELDDSQKLSLSLYPVTEGLDVDAARNTFRERSGDPTVTPFTGSLEVFADQEHITTSARDLTLIQLSNISLSEAVDTASSSGFVFWAIPTIRSHRAGYGVYTANGNSKHYRFIDGQGSAASHCPHGLQDLGTGPGAGATDQRVPELGDDLSVLRSSKITMAQGIAAVEAKYGTTIEAKFELGDDGKLSLSIYPLGKSVNLDAARNTFFEAAGDPTAATYAPELSEFTVPDVEHLSTSARDLTLVQTASFSLKAAVSKAQQAMPDGFVFWAIPTIRDTRAGYGVYVYAVDGSVHYYFVD